LIAVIAVDVRYFGDSFFDFKWAFKKLPKSIPEALKKRFNRIKGYEDSASVNKS